MGANAFDRLFVAEVVKGSVDEAYKKAKHDAEDELARLRDEYGSLSTTSKYFGPEAGEYKYSQTRKKKIVEWNLADRSDFKDWCVENPTATAMFALENAEDFGKWWFEETGELPDGISRVEYEQPAGLGAPKIYRLDSDVITGKLGGNLFEGANRLLLGEADGEGL